jgi:hypothetical protein
LNALAAASNRSVRLGASSALVLLGLAIRVVTVPLRGTHDVGTYLEWGSNTVDHGLVHTYQGIYFPLQYEIFAQSVRVSRWIDLAPDVTLKIFTFGADVACFLLLILILRLLQKNAWYAFLYWLNPYFLSISWLAYIDFYMGACVLLALYCLLRWPTVTGYLGASASLAAATLLKPQIETILLVIVVTLGVEFFLLRQSSQRTPSVALLLVAPLVALSATLAYFAMHGAGAALVRSYLPSTIATQSPSLTANMPNIWSLAAAIEAKPGQPLWAVEGPRVAHAIAALVGVTLIVVGVFLIVQRLNASREERLVFIFALVMMLQPLVVTRAHENHFFLGGLLGVIVVAILADRWAAALFSVLLGLQAINLIGRYALGDNDVSAWHLLRAITAFYPGSGAVQALVGLLVSGVFVVFGLRVVKVLRWRGMIRT